MKQGVLQESATPKYPLGMRIALGDRVYRYVPADADRQLRAAYAVTPDVRYAETGVPTVEAAVRQSQITLTAVGTVAKDEFAGGTLSKAGGGGGGYGVNYKIKSNSAAAPGATFTVNLDDAIIVAIPITDTVTLFHSPWRRVFCQRQRSIDGIATDLRKGSFIGVPNIFVTKNYFCWIQTWGPCMVVPAGGTEGVADDERTMIFQEDGSVSKPDYSTPHEQQIAGFVLPVTTAGAIPDLLEIFLQIAP
ncbi:hypothetical protein ES703_44421 [subsurface metagenome]